MLLFLMPKINNNSSKQSSRHTVPSLENRNKFVLDNLMDGMKRQKMRTPENGPPKVTGCQEVCY